MNPLEPPPPRSDAPDSFTRGLSTAARSRQGKRLIASLWPYLLAAATAVGGYVVRSLQLEPRLELLEKRLETIDSSVASVHAVVVKFTTAEQQKSLSIGRQAAYATAGFQAYEPPRLKAQKQAWAAKYADAYERMVGREGVVPEVAYIALFKDVSVP